VAAAASSDIADDGECGGVAKVHGPRFYFSAVPPVDQFIPTHGSVQI